MSIGTNIKTEKYNPDRIELIKMNLEQHAELGTPRFYEIQVDGLRAVSRTQDVKQFNTYELYVDETAERLKIMLFQGTSMKYDTFNFICNNTESLQGIVPANLSVEEKIHQALRDKELIDVKAKVEELQLELDEAIEYQETLEDKIAELESVKPNSTDKLVNLITTYGEMAINNNPNMLKKIPMIGETLAGGVENKLALENQALKMQIEELKNALQQLGYTIGNPNQQSQTTTFNESQKEEE